MIIEFIKPKLIGPKFEDHSIPLGFLRDLAVFEEIIVEAAKSEFMKNNPKRQRVPKGFSDGITLTLSKIGVGSAVAEISLRVENGDLFPPQNVTYYENAKVLIMNAIRAAERNEPIDLPERVSSLFDKIGRDLAEDEAIEFEHANGKPAATLTRDNRKRLALASSEAREYSEELRVRGTISEVDLDKKSFQIKLLTGKRIEANFPTSMREVVADALKGAISGISVMVVGIGKYSAGGQLHRITQITEFSILEELDVGVQLDGLRILEAGWFDGDGVAINHDALNWLEKHFERYYSDDLNIPYFYPTVEGNVRVEWTVERNEISIEIDLTTKIGYWHSVNLDTRMEDEREYNLSMRSDWEEIGERIRDLNGELV